MRKIITSLFCLLLAAPAWADEWGGGLSVYHHSDCDKILPVILALFVLLLAAGAAMAVMHMFKYRGKKLLPYFFGLSFFITPVFVLTFGAMSVAYWGLFDFHFKGLAIFPIVWGSVGLISSLGGLFGIRAGYGKKMWLAVATSCLMYLLIAVPLTIVYFLFFQDYCRPHW